ncbi:MAG: YtxH domain-containing protein [Patescibacteria group bacterium]
MGSNRFSDGFLLGALVGGAAVFLFATKKGNKILSAITEQGMSGLSDFIEDLEETREGLRPVPEEAPEEEMVLETPKTNGANPTSSRKRFFKRKTK